MGMHACPERQHELPVGGGNSEQHQPGHWDEGSSPRQPPWPKGVKKGACMPKPSVRPEEGAWQTWDALIRMPPKKPQKTHILKIQPILPCDSCARSFSDRWVRTAPIVFMIPKPATTDANGPKTMIHAWRRPPDSPLRLLGCHYCCCRPCLCRPHGCFPVLLETCPSRHGSLKGEVVMVAVAVEAADWSGGGSGDVDVDWDWDWHGNGKFVRRRARGQAVWQASVRPQPLSRRIVGCAVFLFYVVAELCLVLDL